jgi:beta-glucosidase-like glycosyl hydrolase
MDPYEMEMIYLQPFRAAFQDAGALGVMSSYNDYDGVPISASPYFLTDILRKRWGFKGYVVSGSKAVEYIESKHHVAADYPEAVRQAVAAGLNIRTEFTMPDVFINAGEQAEIDKARELAKQVDAAVVVLGENQALIGESRSRTSLDLTGFQLRLVQAVQEAGKPTVVVLLNGRPLSINWIDKYVPAVVEAWFQVLVGASSEDIRLRGAFEIK